MRKFMIVGAGRSGRGFIARLLHKYGEIVFADRDEGLIERLNSECSFKISYFSDRPTETISSYRAYTTDDPSLKEEMLSCDAIFVSVGSKNVPSALSWLHSLDVPEGKHIYVCENGIFSRDELPVLKSICSLGLIFCSTTTDEGLDISSEDMDILYLDDSYKDENLHGIKELVFKENFPSLIRRKIYTYNAASAIIGFLGKDRGYDYLGDAANDPYIHSMLDRFYSSINRCICSEYGVSASEQQDFSLMSWRKFSNTTIKDPIDRNIRDPKNKLLPSERLIGPLRLLLKYEDDIAPIAVTIASASRMTGEVNDSRSFEKLMKEHCQLDEGTIEKLLPYFVQ
ncbi:MAG: hypothetical protein II749_02935 [Clostridia bacterium]|nr:hypothetical protein [Clostridia bacterium]